MFRFQRKNSADSKPFSQFSTDFQKTFNSVFHNLWKDKIARNFGNFSGYRESFPVRFPRKSDFLFQQFQHAIFWKIFAVPFSSSFPQNFPQVFLFNSTIFQLFKMSNVLSTFPHKFNNCIVEKKNQQFRHFSDFSTVSTAPTTTTNFFNLSILSKRHTQNRKYHGNCGNFPQFLDDTDRNRALNCPFQ